VAIAIADGISTSAVGDIASATAVRALLEDSYGTADSLIGQTPGTSADDHQLPAACKSRDHPHHLDCDRGYVYILNALVIKSSAHWFHGGDTRIYQPQRQSLAQLTEDHRPWVAADTSYLSRTLEA
jgi:serine/threonine protein phosphatase PrpC